MGVFFLNVQSSCISNGDGETWLAQFIWPHFYKCQSQSHVRSYRLEGSISNYGNFFLREQSLPSKKDTGKGGEINAIEKI